jgi:pterin-4a-carbinolamine dehydratase
MKRSFTFSSAAQAQSFVQGVSRFCVEKDHHPEWSVSDGGRTVNVTLTSHFAGNKVTLFDFQLAEHMNNQLQVSQKWYWRYPLLEEKSWSSIKIAFVGLFLFSTALQIGTHWGENYATSRQRGHRPQYAQLRPIIVGPFEISAGTNQSEKGAELVAKANVDDFAFKTSVFNSRKII